MFSRSTMLTLLLLSFPALCGAAEERKQPWVPVQIGHQILEAAILGPPFLVGTVAKIGYDSLYGRTSYQELKNDNSNASATILLHGKGANDVQFLPAKSLLNGRVYSFNYMEDENGKTLYLSNADNTGLDDAANFVRKNITAVSKETGIRKFNLLGHSLGGVMAMSYAENFSEKDGIEIPKVVTVHSPLQGTPFIARAREKSCGLLSLKGKLYDDMQESGKVLGETRTKAIKSVQDKKRAYYHINGTSDLLVPPSHGVLKEGLCPEQVYGHAHYGAAADPRVWWQVNAWLKEHSQ